MITLSTTSFGQAVEEGNVLVDVYYGFPNLYTAVFKSAYANSGSEVDLKIGGIGPVGLRAEYLLADKVGLGVDIGFSNSSVKYSELSSVYNETTMEYESRLYDYNFVTQKIGVMATFNYHFLDNDKVDAYVQVGAGYGKRSFKFESTDPNYSEGTVTGVIPFAGRLGVGARYFFTDNIGLNMNLGFGQGGLVNGGLTVKF